MTEETVPERPNDYGVWCDKVKMRLLILFVAVVILIVLLPYLVLLSDQYRPHTQDVRPLPW